jgi:hypothetical protein
MRMIEGVLERDTITPHYQPQLHEAVLLKYNQDVEQASTSTSDRLPRQN